MKAEYRVNEKWGKRIIELKKEHEYAFFKEVNSVRRADWKEVSDRDTNMIWMELVF